MGSVIKNVVKIFLGRFRDLVICGPWNDACCQAHSGCILMPYSKYYKFAIGCYKLWSTKSQGLKYNMCILCNHKIIPLFSSYHEESISIHASV